MHLRSMLMLSLGLGAGTVLPTSAQLSFRQSPAEHPCDAPAAAADAGIPKGHAVVATVKRVDPLQGRLEFTTETGSFVLTTSAALHDLRVGEHLLLCLHAEGSDSQARLAEDTPATPSRTP